jgi:predicted ABC-type ATPase
MRPDSPKRILIIAGPNGAGKTTYAIAWLREGGYKHFVNADLIAKGLLPSILMWQPFRLGV